MKECKVSLRFNTYMQSITTLILQFILYHCVSCTALGLFYDVEQAECYAWLLLLGVPLVYLTVVRAFTKKFIVFFLLHLPVFFIVGFVGEDFAQKVVISVSTILMSVISLHMCMMVKGSVRECPPMKLVLLLFVCYGIAIYQGSFICASYIYVETLVFILCNLIHEGMENTSDFIKLNKDVANLPTGQILIINRMALVLILVVTAIAMLLVPMLHLEIIVTPILAGMLAVIKWMLSMVHLPEASEEVEHIAGLVKGNSLVDEFGKSESWSIWLALEEAMKIGVVIFLAVAIVGGIVYVMFRLYKGFYAESKENTDEKDFLLDAIEWLPRRKISRRKNTEMTGSANQQVRKLYRRFVKKRFKRKETIPATLTPEEILLLLTEKECRLTTETQRRIREIYERARYGQMECTLEDVEEMKRLVG